MTNVYELVLERWQVKVAFVHDWLVTYRGGERVLEALLELYPEAPIFTLFYDAAKMPSSISTKKIITPPGLAFFGSARKALLPFLPAAIESFDLAEYDLVISTSSCVAKGCVPGPNTKHISYIHSPMRYIWDQKEHYFAGFKKIPLLNWLAEIVATKLRLWDTVSAARVDRFIANSAFVAQRVQRYYRREATVIHPPVDLQGLAPKERAANHTPYFLAAGAWVSYKRFDLAIAACRLAGKKLIIAGSGPMEAQLTAMASGKDVEIRKSPSREQWISLMQGAEALLFPGTEDFGITAIEALACGTPVLAHRSGGALDFIEENVNGVFFDSFSSENLAAALKLFDRKRFNTEKVAATATKYSREQFIQRFKEELRSFLQT